MTATGFRPDGLEEAYRSLDELPRSTWLQAIINSRGRIRERLPELAALHQALSRGELTGGADCWPGPPALEPFRAVIGRLDLARLARHGEGVADQVVQTLLWHADRIVDALDRGVPEAIAAAEAAEAFAAEWQPAARDLEDVLNVFDTLRFCRAESLDALRGLLRTAGWQELLRIHRLLAHLPALRELFRRLGRARDSENEAAQPLLAPVSDQVTANAMREREIRVPGLVAETCGVTRGGAVSRMLPSEAAMMRHPRLRMAWFARLAERSLLVYEDEDRLVERFIVDADAMRPSREPRPQARRERGPMILCVDTSASMAGGAENVAKAVVLEGMRVAAAEGRACYVYAFGGPGEILEREFGLDVAGIGAATDFMAQGFGGGTDICEPLQRAIERVHQHAWREADLVIASDGEFGATPAVAVRVREARHQLGLRVQGVLVGDRETIGLLEVCDDIFWVSDWRKFGGSGAETPVHSRRLTALYFPGALRS